MGIGPGNLLTEDIIKKYYPEDLGHINRLKLLHFKKLKTKYNWGPNKYYKSAAIFGIHPTYIQEMLSEKRYKKKDYENIMSVKNVIRNERPQGSYMLTILRVGIDSQRIDTIEITE